MVVMASSHQLYIEYRRVLVCSANNSSLCLCSGFFRVRSSRLLFASLVFVLFPLPHSVTIYSLSARCWRDKARARGRRGSPYCRLQGCGRKGEMANRNYGNQTSASGTFSLSSQEAGCAHSALHRRTSFKRQPKCGPSDDKRQTHRPNQA